MTNVLLSGLLAGTLALGAPTEDAAVTPPPAVLPDSADVAAAYAAEAFGAVADGPVTAESTGDEAAAPAGRSVFATEAAPTVAAPTPVAVDPVQDHYAFGIASPLSPVKLWVHYAYGEADGTYDVDGEEAPLTVAGTEGDIIAQRLVFGGQLNVINFPVFRLGAGAQGVVAKNEFVVDEDGTSAFTNPIGDIESDFEFQNVKVYGVARGRVVGVHGGYIFDLGNPREFGGEQARANVPGFGEQPLSIDADGNILPSALVAGNPAFQELILPTSLSTSDGRDAIFFGADFDLPSDRFRLFGGIDYYMLQTGDDEEGTPFDESTFDNDDYLNFLFGAGVKASVFEVGAALQILSRLDNPTTADVGTVRGIGGHIRRISPYVRISPPQIPASIFVKGAVLEEYTDSGLPLGGANAIKSNIGFTAGLTVGFN